jgi:UDP-N-acetyl-D-glucosamine dehydrogenase
LPLALVFCEAGFRVIAAASTKPFGYMPFYPGPGLGGHCIPLDPFYLSWKAAEHGMWARFIELAGEINTQMPRFVISRVATALNDAGKALKGSRVLVLGLAYKANIDDCRESPSFELLEQLKEAGAHVEYCDPHFPEAPRTRKYDLQLRSVPCSPEAFSTFDALVVATAHDEFKNPDLYRGVKLVIDSRNMIAPLLLDQPNPTVRVVKA